MRKEICQEYLDALAKDDSYFRGLAHATNRECLTGTLPQNRNQCSGSIGALHPKKKQKSSLPLEK